MTFSSPIPARTTIALALTESVKQARLGLDRPSGWFRPPIRLAARAAEPQRVRGLGQAACVGRRRPQPRLDPVAGPEGGLMGEPGVPPCLIGVPRFELGTSPTRTERATRLRHTPSGYRL